ncbi:hypothetical protein P0Y35_18325 [Kiritimatiellaeota bacterium B1221]|nr:hypothetical protein [Kiritimatiellaeota bacterium B1221]
MKKLIITLALALSSNIAVQAQPVYSNIVGMVKVTAESGKNTYVASNFIPDGGEITVEELLGDSLPSRSRVFFWNSTGGAEGKGEYETAVYGTRGWSNGDISIERSKGFIINIPEEDPQNSYTIVLSGSVPSASEEPNASVVLEVGLTLTAYPYPVTKKISEAGFSPDSLDQIFIWDGTEWLRSTYGTRNGWSSDLDLNPGVSFFYKKASLTSTTWEPTNPVPSN